MPFLQGMWPTQGWNRISNVSCTGRRVLYHWNHSGINTTVVMGAGVQLLSWVWGRVQRRLAEPPAALEDAPRPWSVPLGERGPETQGARAHNLPVWTHVPLAGASTSRHHHGAGGPTPSELLGAQSRCRGQPGLLSLPFPSILPTAARRIWHEIASHIIRLLGAAQCRSSC